MAHPKRVINFALFFTPFSEAVLKCFQEILRMIFEVFLRVEEGAMRASKPMKLGRNDQKATQNPERFYYIIFLVTFQNSFSILRILLAVITPPGQFRTAQDNFRQPLPPVHSQRLGVYRLDFGCLADTNHFLCAKATNRTRCLRQ